MALSSWPPKLSIYEISILHLFSQVDISSLSSDVCIRAKQNRVSFLSQPYKPTQPFTLIHSDGWGPSLVTTTSEKRWFVNFIDDQTYLTWVLLTDMRSRQYFNNFTQPLRHNSTLKL